MARREKEGFVSVRLNKNGKSLNFSTRASVPFMGYDDVEIFEKEGVVAVCGALQGSYHISMEKGRPRKALSNAQLVEYICKKFGYALGGVLPAWTGEQENVLFFGGMQPHAGRYVLDESYTPIEVDYNRRAGNWAYVHDNWIEFTQEVRETLPTRLSAFRCGRVVVLSGDPAGKLTLTPRRQSGNLMLVSHPLADHLRGLYGGEERGMRLRAAVLPGGVALADSQDLLSAVDLTRLERLTLDEGKYSFLTLGNRGTLYLSTPAWKQITSMNQLDVYGGMGYLALRTAREGAMRVTTCGYAHYIHSKRFFALLKERWPEARRIYLLRYGEQWLLWPHPSRPAGLPFPTQFRKINLAKAEEKRKPQPQRVASSVAAERTIYGR